MKKSRPLKQPKKKITEYDTQDTTSMIDTSRPLRFEDLGVRLPSVPSTQVISIRLPSELLNEIKALGSQQDIPYQALIKLFLAQSLVQTKKKLER
ncbi:MAG: hypothetical protein A3F16_05580 [Deltaproteobacteria bacterium RIFCSPHIGHO2_12_FULL_43_9]|nr:MAG: hypothetical protein A3F16_05580 [Deltaproteobacteria bacterium RIFCSPHIGHO2_12_FULL_43_9]